MRTFVLAASAALALLPAALTAQATWVATLDLEYGGDTVAELLFTAGWRWVYAGYTVMTYRTGSGASANASALGAGFSYAF